MTASGRDAPADAGFTLIEVVVALAILAVVLFAFYEFLSGSLAASGRVHDAADAYDHDQNALALVANLNPMDQPEGVFDLGEYRIRWKASLIGEVRRTTAYPAGVGRFSVALYRVVLDFPDNPELSAVAVTKLGYRLAAPSNTEPKVPE
jgi:prepilin-type N-terminal cleavage/methylation domain-containing protein